MGPRGMATDKWGLVNLVKSSKLGLVWELCVRTTHCHDKWMPHPCLPQTSRELGLDDMARPFQWWRMRLLLALCIISIVAMNWFNVINMECDVMNIIIIYFCRWSSNIRIIQWMSDYVLWLTNDYIPWTIERGMNEGMNEGWTKEWTRLGSIPMKVACYTNILSRTFIHILSAINIICFAS